MKENKDLKKLLRRKKAFVKGINVMYNKLYEIDFEIATLLDKRIDEISENEEKTSNLMTQKEVCDELKISPSTLYRLRTQNDLPFVKINGRKNIMFNRKDIEEYYKNNK